MNKAIDVYAAARTERPRIKTKHLAQFDREFLHLSGADPSMSVLEIGCGTGIFLRYLQARGFKDVVGLDSDLGLAPVLDDLSGFDIQLVDGKAYLAQVSGPRFDRIVLFDVAEHLPEPVLAELMRSLARVLKPGGKVVMRSPNCASPWGLKMQFDTFDHITPITSGRMNELAAATGFVCRRVIGGTRGSGLRRLTQAMLHGLLRRCLAYGPDIWDATIIGLFEKADS
ncbi:MAG: class I SAM-dependent methyltransferase [Magnetospirillum sp.]|nr:class I SAM-dependent methyltransferase [Magnetospirillum sp.]